jgi:hypothetical protein
MTLLQPPSLATSLLKRLGRSDHDETLIGDLCEEYQRRRSAAWYWRQVLIAMAVGCFQEIRDHKLLTARAILTAVISWYGLGPLYRATVGSFYNHLVWTMPGVGGILFLLVGVVIPAISIGWLVGRFHRQHPAAMVLAVAVFILTIHLPELCRRVLNALDDARYISALVDQVRSMIVGMGCVLLGGLSVPVRLESQSKATES